LAGLPKKGSAERSTRHKRVRDLLTPKGGPDDPTRRENGRPQDRAKEP